MKCTGFSITHAQTTPLSTLLQVQSPYKSNQENPFLLHAYTTHLQNHSQPSRCSSKVIHQAASPSSQKAWHGGRQVQGMMLSADLDLVPSRQGCAAQQRALQPSSQAGKTLLRRCCSQLFPYCRQVLQR